MRDRATKFQLEGQIVVLQRVDVSPTQGVHVSESGLRRCEIRVCSNGIFKRGRRPLDLVEALPSKPEIAEYSRALISWNGRSVQRRQVETRGCFIVARMQRGIGVLC